MATHNALTPLDPADYSAIEAAVLETARGRWFLAEYARRNRHADTQIVLEAFARLEQSMTGEATAGQLEKVRAGLAEMADVIERTKTEVAALRQDGDSIRHFEEATLALDIVVKTTEKATSDILEAAEFIQEAAWTLRERGADSDQCDIIDRRATDIYTACTFQDLTAQRTKKVVHTLAFLEGRIKAMIDAWSGNEQAGGRTGDRPPSILESEVLTQDAVDIVVEDDSVGFDDAPISFEVEEMGPEPFPSAPPAPQDMPATPAMQSLAIADEAPAADPDRELAEHPVDAAAVAGDLALSGDDDDPLASFDEEDNELVFVERHGGEVTIPPIPGAPLRSPLAELDDLMPEERLRRFT